MSIPCYLQFASGIIGQAVTDLDGKSAKTLTDGMICFVSSPDGVFRVFVYDILLTEATDAVNYSYVRPFDYAGSGCWKNLSVAVPVAQGVPTGTIAWFTTETAPTGWSHANGGELSRTGEANLFAVIGTMYGNGDGSTTFNKPKINGRVIRGWDDGEEVEPAADAAARTDRGDGTTGDHVGTNQADAFESHTHNFMMLGAGTAGIVSPLGGNISGQNPIGTTSTGGNETRMVNITLLPMIKL